MGGKTWSVEEEHLFWHVIVPRSPKAVNPSSRALSWEECAHEMQEMMGDDARRKYTKLMLFEHYFQNVSTGHKSPHARKYVLEHKRELETATGKADSVSSPEVISSCSSGDERIQPSVLPTQQTAPPPHAQGIAMPAHHFSQGPHPASLATDRYYGPAPSQATAYQHHHYDSTRNGYRDGAPLATSSNPHGPAFFDRGRPSGPPFEDFFPRGT